MASINSKTVVRELIKNKGRYDNDPQVISIYAYDNIFDGRETYCLCYSGYDEAAAKVGATPNLRLLWHQETGTTANGDALMEEVSDA